MNLVTKQDIDNLIAQTPDTPQNHGLLNQLYNLSQSLKVIRKPWTYSSNFTALAAAGAAPQQQNIAIDSTAPFIILSQTYFADIALAAQTSGTFVYPLVTVLLVDTGNNENMMDIAAPVTSMFGNGQFPFVLPEPKIMAANSTLQITANNFSAATVYNLRLSFHGYRLYANGSGVRLMLRPYNFADRP